MLLFAVARRGHPAPASLRPVMAITTDSTQRTAGPTRPDSSTVDSQPSARASMRERAAGAMSREPAIGSSSGDRSTGRLRPLSSGSPHESVVPDRQSADATRRMAPSEFNTAMAHFYRGEVTRSNTWRTRLDTTTYWAVLTAGATLSFTFSSPLSPHFVIPINSILVAVFLVMEARR
jgi:hypothetical protein